MTRLPDTVARALARALRLAAADALRCAAQLDPPPSAPIAGQPAAAGEPAVTPAEYQAAAELLRRLNAHHGLHRAFNNDQLARSGQA